MAMNIDWGTALLGAAVGWMACNKVEDTKNEVKKAVNETAAAAATAAAQAALQALDQFQPGTSGAGAKTGNGQNGQG